MNPLLEVQRLDTEADQIRHTREHLPTRAALEEARREQAEHQRRIEEIAVERLAVIERQRRLEGELGVLEERIAADERRLYSGEVAALRDLQALQDEIAGLRSRAGELEERILEAMETAEGLEARVDELKAAAAGVDARVAELEARLAAEEAELDAALAANRAERAERAAAVDPDLLADYERLRPGFGAATVVTFDRNCVGCPSSMPAVEADRVLHAAPGSVLHCEECGRIVLR
ncbi:MAG: hypothetical protein D6683_12800 [Actinomyces sp.]|nr:MAG: hypothetical protein D6683_12800 [Actinomyces sp.]